jgi:uncharacterized membrane protein
MKRYKNKKTIVGLFLVITLVVILVATKSWKQPSQEMLNLRKIEQQLSLPTPKSRIEEDIGKNTDWKGASHYTRYILLYYDNADSVESVVQKLPSSGWSQANENEFEGSKSYSFVNKNLQACISAKIDPQSSDSLPHNIFIKAVSDDGCSFYFRDE